MAPALLRRRQRTTLRRGETTKTTFDFAVPCRHKHASPSLISSVRRLALRLYCTRRSLTARRVWLFEVWTTRCVRFNFMECSFTFSISISRMRRRRRTRRSTPAIQRWRSSSRPALLFNPDVVFSWPPSCTDGIFARRHSRTGRWGTGDDLSLVEGVAKWQSEWGEGKVAPTEVRQ